MNSEVGEEWGQGRNHSFSLCCRTIVSRDSAEKKFNQTITGPTTYGADYILEILGQKWRALPNFLALRNRQNLVLGKNNQVSLTIGQILGTAAENTGWLISKSYR